MTKDQTIAKEGQSPLAESFAIPFEREKVIGFNVNFFGIFLNLVLTLCRIAIIVFSMTKLASYVLVILFQYNSYFSFTLGTLDFYKRVSVLINIFVNFCLVVDCINPSYILKNFGDYRARMAVSRFAAYLGINVHVYRLAMLTVALYEEHVNLGVFSQFQKIDDTDSLVLNVVDLLFVPAAALYALALLLKYLGVAIRNVDELSHPWIEGWESKYELRSAKKRNFGKAQVLLLLMNISVLCLFLQFFLTFKIAEERFHLYPQEVFNNFFPLFTITILLVDLVYRLLLRVKSRDLTAVFVFNGLFIAYFCLQMYIELNTSFSAANKAEFEDFFNVHMWFLAGAFGINVILFLLMNMYQNANFFLWSVKWGFSLGGLAAILYIVGTLVVLLSGVYSSYALFQQYFYMNMRLNPDFKRFLEVMKTIYDIVLVFIGIVESIVGVLNSTGLGIFCIILFVIVNIILPILSFIGWGVPIPLIVAGKVFEVIMSIFKIISSVRGFLPLFTSIATFTEKSKMMESAATNSSAAKFQTGGFFYMLMNLFGLLMTLAGVLAAYFHASERYNATNRPFYIVFLFCVEVGFLCVIPVIYLMEFIFSRKYDLIILVVNFYPGWGIFWVKVGVFLFCAGVLVLLFSNIIGKTDGHIKNRYFFQSLVVEEFVNFPLLPLICPLLSMPKNRKNSENACVAICNRFFCCCVDKDIDKLDHGNAPIRYARELFCPCFVDLEPEKDEPKLVNLLSNFCCCCCYDKTLNRKVNVMRTCFCVQNYFRLREKKEILDNSFETSYNMTYDDASKLDYIEIPVKTHHYLEAPPEKKQELAFVKNAKTVFSNGFKKFAQYLIPILATAAVYYLIYKSLTSTWLLIKFEPDSMFGSVLNDTSTEANSDHVNDVEKSGKSMCPLLDLIEMLKNLILKAVFAALGSLFPQYKDFVDRLKRILIYIMEMGKNDLIPVVLRLIILLPAFFFCVTLSILSIVSSFIKPFTRLIIVFCLLPLFAIYIALLGVPDMIKGIVESIPFFDVAIFEEIGYSYAKTVYFGLFFIIVLIIVDHFMPPTYPLRMYEEEYVDIYDKEMDHVFTINP